MSTNDAARATAEFVPLVPYPGQEPVNEIDNAMAQLRTLSLALMADSQNLACYTTADAEAIIGGVLGQLNPIRTFLAENEFGDMPMPFLECRRRWVAREGGAQ